jgi:putative oxidoreductase
MSSPLFASTQRQHAIAITIVRVITGIVFTAHGYQKLFVYGIAGVQKAFTTMGAPMPMVTAPLVGGLEFFGGLALVAGLLTRLVGLGLAIDMLGAIVLVHHSKGFFLPMGYEFVLLLLVLSLSLVVGGSGSYSVDGIIADRSGSSQR